MSLVYMEGYDTYTGAAYISSSRGGKKYHRNGSTSTGILWAASIPVAQQHNTVIVGFYLEQGHSSESPGYYNLVSIGGIAVRWVNGGSLRVMGPAGTQIYETAAGLWPLSTGIFMETKVFVHDTAGYVIVKLNGTIAVNLTNIDTQSGGSDLVTSVSGDGFSYSFTSNYTTIDDIYILTAAGSTNNDFLGDCHISLVQPNGNGTYSDWVGSDADSTDNYLLVDDLPSAADYVEASAVGATDTYAFPDLVDAVVGVRVTASALRTDSVEAKQLALVLRDGVGTEIESAPTVINTSTTVVSQVFDLQPDGTTWNLSDFNGTEFGIRVAV